RGDPVRYLAHAPQIVPFHTRRGAALLDLAGLIDHPYPQAPPPAPTAGGLIQPGHREPAHHSHRSEGIPHRAVEQPLRLLRRPVPGPARKCPPGCGGAGRCPRHGLFSPPAATAPPGRNTAAAIPAAHHASEPPRRPLSWRQQPPSFLLSSHTHDRQAAAPCRTGSLILLRSRSNPEWRLPY